MNKLCSLVILILCGNLVTGCSQNYRAEKDFWKAEKSLRGVRKADLQVRGPEALEHVIISFERIADRYPSSVKAAESLFVAANLRIRQRKFDEARNLLVRIVRDYDRLENKTVEARYGIAQIFEIQGRWEEAADVYWEAAENHPLHPKGLYAPVHIILHYRKLGEKTGEQKAFHRALAYYENKLAEIGPIRAAGAIKNYQALAHLAHGEWATARQIWMQIPEAYPESPFAPLSVLAAGELSWKKKDFAAAISSYRFFVKTYRKHPFYGKALLQLGLVFLDSKDFVRSREWLNRALNKATGAETKAEIYFLLGRSYQEEGAWEDADRVYRRIEEEFPDSAAALQVPLMRSVYFESAGEPERAGQILTDALARYMALEQKASEPAVKHLAQKLQNAAYSQKGDWAKVMDNFDRNIATERSPLRRGSWLFLKALVAENRLKNNTEAALLYNDFLKQYPEHPLAHLAKSRVEQVKIVQTAAPV